MLLDVRELFEAAIAVSTFIWLFAGVNTNVLNELMIAAEALQALLTLMGFYVATHAAARRWWTAVALDVARMLHLHCTLMHENLWIKMLQSQ